jgi:hypothetical protein
VNAAGRLLIDYASAAECVLGTGRVLGDVGQATFVGSPGQIVASRPDYVIMSGKLFGAAQSARIAPVWHISDHCTMSLVFRVDDVSFNADWTTAHVCSSGGCGTKFVLKWNPERAGIYGEVLADSTVMQDQFAQALEERDHEKACFCLRSLIVHAASDFRVGMGRHKCLCSFVW